MDLEYNCSYNQLFDHTIQGYRLDKGQVSDEHAS